ncbi:MAG: hypothetical protein H7178_06820 [Chitinophagaceae bacterium]|nr:hypothetical protein [Chitinophagaceae bacterium]
MNALELRTYEIFKTKLGEKEAETIIEFIEAKSKQQIEEKKDVFMVKQDKIDLIEKMNQDKLDMIKWMFGFWVSLVLLLLANWFLKKN